MIFTNIARVLAVIICLYGVGLLTLGFYVASDAVPAELAPRYLGSKTSGQAIDRGIYVFLVGIVLGVLTEISRSLNRSN